MRLFDAATEGRRLIVMQSWERKSAPQKVLVAKAPWKYGEETDQRGIDRASNY